MKKICIIFAAAMVYFSSVAFAFVMGGSNLDIMGYPAFNGFISYNPTYEEVQEYVSEAKEYVINGNNDIQRIREAQNDAIQKANDAVNSYNNYH